MPKIAALIIYFSHLNLHPIISADEGIVSRFFFSFKYYKASHIVIFVCFWSSSSIEFNKSPGFTTPKQFSLKCICSCDCLASCPRCTLPLTP